MRVPVGGCAIIVSDPARDLLPRSARISGLRHNLCEHRLRDRVQQSRLAIDVVVDRHRVDPELVGQAAHTESLQAVAVDQDDRGGRDPLPAEPCRPTLRTPGHPNSLPCETYAVGYTVSLKPTP